MERKWWTLVAVCTAIFMLLLDITRQHRDCELRVGLRLPELTQAQLQVRMAPELPCAQVVLERPIRVVHQAPLAGAATRSCGLCSLDRLRSLTDTMSASRVPI